MYSTICIECGNCVFMRVYALVCMPLVNRNVVHCSTTSCPARVYPHRLQVKQLMIQLLSAIDHMHQKWYIHRDLKSSNLLYSNKGFLAVCDFGLARKYGR